MGLLILMHPHTQLAVLEAVTEILEESILQQIFGAQPKVCLLRS